MNGDEPGLCQVLSLVRLSPEEQLGTSSLSLGLGFLTYHITLHPQTLLFPSLSSSPTPECTSPDASTTSLLGKTDKQASLIL